MVHKGSCRWQTYIVGDSFSVLSAPEDDVPWAPPLSVWPFRILSGKKHTTFPIIYRTQKKKPLNCFGFFLKQIRLPPSILSGSKNKFDNSCQLSHLKNTKTNHFFVFVFRTFEIKTWNKSKYQMTPIKCLLSGEVTFIS